MPGSEKFRWSQIAVCQGKILECGRTPSALAKENRSMGSFSCFLQKIRSLISSDKTRDMDALRLVMLYALRYEKHSNNDLTGLVQALERRGVPEKQRKASDVFFPPVLKINPLQSDFDLCSHKTLLWFWSWARPHCCRDHALNSVAENVYVFLDGKSKTLDIILSGYKRPDDVFSSSCGEVTRFCPIYPADGGAAAGIRRTEDSLQ